MQHREPRADRSHRDGRHPAGTRVAGADPATGAGQGQPADHQPEHPYGEGQVGPCPPVADGPALGGRHQCR